MDDRLNDMYLGVAVPATADNEHIAALELLALIMAADREITDAEVEEIRQITSDWRDDDFPFDEFLPPALEKAQTAIAAGETLALIDDIDLRIHSHVLRRALFSAARDVAGVDADLTPEEGSVLAEVAVRFS